MAPFFFLFSHGGWAVVVTFKDCGQTVEFILIGLAVIGSMCKFCTS